MTAAQSHSVDMACNNFLDHTGSGGSYISERLSRAGYPIGIYYTEIIAIGTPQDAINQWQSDESHWNAVPAIPVLGKYKGSFGNAFVNIAGCAASKER